MFDRRAFIEARREENELLSEEALNRMADFEQLEWAISDMEDISDVKHVLNQLVDLVRTQ